MTTKLEEAARQALDALEMYNEHGAILRPLETTNALREALAEQERKAKYDERFERLEKFEQAEQEPDKPLYRKVLREMLDAHEQAEQEPVATVVDESEEQTNTMSWILSLPLPVGTKLYAALVRTKDLTDEEIEDAVGWTMTEQAILDCRAVIAADREKNRAG